MNVSVYFIYLFIFFIYVFILFYLFIDRQTRQKLQGYKTNYNNK